VLLGIYPKDLKTYIHIKTYTWVFIVPLSIIGITCPSEGKCKNKLSSFQTIYCESVLKRIELSSHEKTWRKHKCRLLSEISHSEKATSCMTLWKRQKLGK
jgi:hypothetical protein